MIEPKLSRDQVAQAVYTWSRTLVDGTRGMGFTSISPSLEASIDWLIRLQIPEFSLFLPSVAPSLTLYEARKGFSEVGRTVRGNIGIIYRKTADGVVDSAGRHQLVVHALFADARALGLLCVNRIREDFWIRQIASSFERLDLPDIAASDIYSTRGSIARHVCPRDHAAALNVLRLIAQRRMERQGEIEISTRRNALEEIALAFPLDIVDSFSLCSYLTDHGIRRLLGVGMHDMTNSNAREDGRRPAGNFDNCQLRQAVMSAAKRFLYVEAPSLRRYAEAVLDLGASSAGGGVGSWRRG